MNFGGYNERFSHESTGHKAEGLTVDLINEFPLPKGAGFTLNAEAANVFDDERLGKDFWVNVEYANGADSGRYAVQLKTYGYETNEPRPLTDDMRLGLVERFIVPMELRIGELETAVKKGVGINRDNIPIVKAVFGDFLRQLNVFAPLITKARSNERVTLEDVEAGMVRVEEKRRELDQKLTQKVG